MKSMLIILIALISCTSAQNDKYVTSDNCFYCSKKPGNYFCHSTKGGSVGNPWEIQCCNEDLTHPYCSAQSDNLCSEKFGISAGEYYSSCPRQNQQSCGMKDNYDGLNLYAFTKSRNYHYEWLRYVTKFWKVTQYQVCSYKVMNPPGGYKGGNIYFQMTKQDAGVQVYIQSNDGKTIPNQLIDSTATYNIAAGDDKYIQITTVPILNSYKTNYEFNFWNDGTKIPNAPIWAKMAEHAAKVKLLNAMHAIPKHYYYVFGGTLFAIVLCIGCVCFYSRRASKLAQAQAQANEGMQQLPESDLTKNSVINDNSIDFASPTNGKNGKGQYKPTKDVQGNKTEASNSDSESKQLGFANQQQQKRGGRAGKNTTRGTR